MPKLNLGELAEFIVEAKRKTFAAGKEEETPEGSKISRFQKGSYSYSDTWDGSKLFQGKELVHDVETKTPVWGMTYRGRDIDIAINNEITNDFLRKALMQVLKEMPYRGPKIFTDGGYPGYLYQNFVTGDLTEFQGRDQVLFYGEHVFRLAYMGGLLKK